MSALFLRVIAVFLITAVGVMFGWDKIDFNAKGIRAHPWLLGSVIILLIALVVYFGVAFKRVITF